MTKLHFWYIHRVNKLPTDVCSNFGEFWNRRFQPAFRRLLQTLDTEERGVYLIMRAKYDALSGSLRNKPNQA